MSGDEKREGASSESKAEVADARTLEQWRRQQSAAIRSSPLALYVSKGKPRGRRRDGEPD
jgi:hypothetical protein